MAEKHFFELLPETKKTIQQTVDLFNTADAEVIKQIEKITNHDVKAVEYFLKDKLEASGAAQLKRMGSFWPDFTGYK